VTILAASLLIACGKKNQPKNAGKPASDRAAGIRSICIYDGISLRAEPGRKGKWLSSIRLGETVYWKGQTAVDSSDKNAKYLNMALSDSTEGWAMEWGIVVDAIVGAVKEDAPIYQRPDPLTVTDEKFGFMDVVAVIDSADRWVKAVGENRSKKGWIERNAVTSSREDVISAVLAGKKMKAHDGLSEPAKIRSIVDEAPFPESYFIKQLGYKIGPEPSDMIIDIPKAELNPDTFKTDRNMLANRSFENDPLKNEPFWFVDDGLGSDVIAVWSDKKANIGAHSLFLSAGRTGSYSACWKANVHFSKGYDYTLQACYMTTDSADAMFGFRFFDRYGRDLIGFTTFVLYPSEKIEWRVERRIVKSEWIPASAAKMQIFLGQSLDHTKGKRTGVYYDDVFLFKSLPEKTSNERL
jgi:hypothetical protein